VTEPVRWFPASSRFCRSRWPASWFSPVAPRGPKSIEVDRFDYSTAIADSWKQQTLLNIVKLRYLDLPVFVDVSSIVAGYSIETSASVGGQLSSAESVQRNSLTLSGASKYTDRPTIT
jgi:hypothetical protein